jgi:hypothetical protein
MKGETGLFETKFKLSQGHTVLPLASLARRKEQFDSLSNGR